MRAIVCIKYSTGFGFVCFVLCLWLNNGAYLDETPVPSYSLRHREMLRLCPSMVCSPSCSSALGAKSCFSESHIASYAARWDVWSVAAVSRRCHGGDHHWCYLLQCYPCLPRFRCHPTCFAFSCHVLVRGLWRWGAAKGVQGRCDRANTR